MNVVVLKVNGAIPGTLTYEITRDGKNLPGVVHQIPFTIKNLFEDEGHIRDLLPPSLVRDIRQWVLDQPAKGILAVDAVNPEMDITPSKGAMAFGGVVCALTVVLYIMFW